MSFRPARPALLAALRAHWPSYLAEAGGLAFFMVCASWLTILLEHPASPVHRALLAHGVGPALRRVPMGLGIGLVIVGLAYNPWGKRSGAHINPAVTLAFWQLGKIRGADALWYGLAQLAGGLAAARLLKALLGAWYADPRIHFITTRPGPAGAGVAFAAEFLISFGLLLVLLLALHSARFKQATGWLTGALLMGYIIWEMPYSGMSLNPSRSLASAVIAGDFASLWVYLLAPPSAMWLAAVLFQRLRSQPAAGQTSSGTAPALPELPTYPDPAAT